MPIFEPKFNFSKNLNSQCCIESWEGCDLIIFFLRFFLFKGLKYWKIYAWNYHATTNRNLRPNYALDKKVKENTTMFKKCIDLLSSTFWSEARIGLKLWFVAAWLFQSWIFDDFGTLKSKYLNKKCMVIILLAFLTILVFKCFKKLNIGFKEAF